MTFPCPCPLCGAPAEFGPVGFPGPRRHYLCSARCEFVIDPDHLDRLENYAATTRLQLAEQARLTFGDHIYVIEVLNRNGANNLDGRPALRREVLR